MRCLKLLRSLWVLGFVLSLLAVGRLGLLLFLPPAAVLPSQPRALAVPLADAAGASASAAAPPPPRPPARIPRRFLFAYGLWEDSLHLDLDAPDCTFSSARPPPCLELSRQAHRLPAAVAAALGAWTARYPHWEAVILDARGAVQLVAQRYPDLAPLYAQLPPGVQRADIARLLLLGAYGGFYLDVDASPQEGDLDALLAAHARAGALVFEEAVLSPEGAAAAGRAHPIRAGRPEARQRIANYFMASAPSASAEGGGGCPRGAVRAMLEAVAQRLRAHPALSPSDADYEVLYTTGPDAVTEAVHALRGWALDGSDILGTTRLVGARDIETVVRAAEPPNACVEVIPRPTDQLYFAHAAAGTWKGRGRGLQGQEHAVI